MNQNELLAVALHHHENGRAVIAVNGNNKRPLNKGWNDLFTRPQTEVDIKADFGAGATGIGLLMYPASQLAALDFDGKHADEALQKTGIELPDTARVFTPSGGKHLYYLMPAEPPALKRKIRLVEADCDCTKDGEPKPCGVDFLINGYAVIPPTKGYREDPDHPLEDAIPIPPEILKLAAAAYRKTEDHRTGNAEGKVSEGKRNATLCSLAGTMRGRGMSIEAVTAALKADNEARFEPPLENREIEAVLKSAAGWEQGVGYQNLTDSGNAHRFAAIHSGNALYSAQRRKWCLWNGRHWEWDLTGAVMDLAIATVQSIYAEAAGCKDKEQREALSQWALKSESRGRIDSMLSLAGSFPGIRTDLERFDKNPYLFNCPNCTIDLRTGIGREHRREDFITKMSPTIFDPQAVCPTFDEFFAGIIADEPVKNFIQRAAGYSLTGDVSEHALMLPYGSGWNGKSTLLNAFAAAMGSDYAKEMKTEVLLESRDNKDAFVAELVGVRMAITLESDKDRKLSVGIVKTMTGGDKIPCCRKYENPFSFMPEFKVWFGTNHKPKINDTTDSIWFRLKPIPFEKCFRPDDPKTDKKLPEKLQAENPGILAWMVRGGLDWQRNGLSAPETIKQATETYRKEENAIANFIEDCCEHGEKETETFNALYDTYCHWCRDNGEEAESKRSFGDCLTEMGIVADRNAGARIRRGLRLKNKE
jgi:putative DNA primase/helicase